MPSSVLVIDELAPDVGADPRPGSNERSELGVAVRMAAPTCHTHESVSYPSSRRTDRPIEANAFGMARTRTRSISRVSSSRAS